MPQILCWSAFVLLPFSWKYDARTGTLVNPRQKHKSHSGTSVSKSAKGVAQSASQAFLGTVKGGVRAARRGVRTAAAQLTTDKPDRAELSKKWTPARLLYRAGNRHHRSVVHPEAEAVKKKVEESSCLERARAWVREQRDKFEESREIFLTADNRMFYLLKVRPPHPEC